MAQLVSAAVGPDLRKVRSRPSIIGIAIGPIRPATHLMTTVMMSLNVGELTCVATAMDRPRKITVVRRAASSPLFPTHCSFAFFETAGATSRVKTAAMAFASEEHMAIVCEKKPTMTRPNRPCGRSCSVIRPYESEPSGFCACTRSGDTHMGKKRTTGQTSHRTAERRAERVASRAEPVAM